MGDGFGRYKARGAHTTHARGRMKPEAGMDRESDGGEELGMQGGRAEGQEVPVRPAAKHDDDEQNGHVGGAAEAWVGWRFWNLERRDQATSHAG
jgi:hypothetical protein